MGFFDFFKRKDAASSNTETTHHTTSVVYKIASKYNEYTKMSIEFMANGNYAPIAAYEQSNGKIVGYLYIMDDPNYVLSATEVVEKMKEEFSNRIEAGSIKSYVIYYHSLFNGDGNHTVADGTDVSKAISIILRDTTQFYKTAAIPYEIDDEGFTAGPMTQVTFQEFQEILNTPVEENKEYFQERITYKAKSTKNEHDVTIKTANIGSVGDLWGGIFGFEYFETMSPDFLYQHINLAQSSNASIHKLDSVEVFQLHFTRMALRTVCLNKNMISAFPRIITETQIDVTLRSLDEWQHVQNLEATISGNGRGTFGIRFYATDYAFNREKYHSNLTLPMHISGIIYVLEKFDEAKNSEEGDINFHPEFCAYMPNQEWSMYGCFDLVAKLEHIEKVNAFNLEEHSGYILKLKLVNNEEIPDFFTIDMFVNTKNMRFPATELQIGMKLTGMFQMLGEIAE